MHFRSGAPCPGACGCITRPDARMTFGEILRDRKRVPDARVAVDEARHLTVGEKLRNAVKLEPFANGVKCSVNAIPSSRISIHGRSDQEE